MDGKSRAAHKWGPAITEDGKLHWRCQRCQLEVITETNVIGPSVTASGRLVNGKLVSRFYVLPSCKAYAPKQAPDNGTDRKKVGIGRDPFAARDHELRTCYEALGKPWVEATIGPRKFNADGSIDLDWEMGLLQLYAAVRVLTLEAVDLIALVRERMRDRAKTAVGDLSTRFKDPASVPPRSRRV